jgi:hypothetical protein
MSDPNSPIKSDGKSEGANEAPISVAVDEELSEQDLDTALGEADPDFLNSMTELGKDKDLSLAQIVISDEQQALNDERDAWEKSGRIGKAVFKAFPGIAKLSLLSKKAEFFAFSKVRTIWIYAKNFFYFLATDGKNKLIGGIKHGVHVVTDQIDEAQRNFRYLSWKLKLSFFGILLLVVGTGFFIYRSMTQGVIPIKNELFIPSMERYATEVFEYDPETEVEPFYENLRVSGNILLIPKMVVNLRKSAHSGENPMGAFEFFIEGMAPEVAIEVKDREIEIRDLMQRAIEEFNFDQVESPEGKKSVTDKLRKEINAVLTTGKIKKVWIKTIIVKP